ncbi:MAG: hypothetical protein ACI82S_002863, partial [Patiriisocius sp.]
RIRQVQLKIHMRGALNCHILLGGRVSYVPVPETTEVGFRKGNTHTLITNYFDDKQSSFYGRLTLILF